jgi:hypothetical protein
MRALADLIDTDPITLSEASSVVLRGIVSVSALRAEIDKGNLMAMRIGKNLFTTPGAVREMMEKCRVKPSHPASISAPTTAPGSSATVDTASEQAALKGIAAALRSGSLTTSRKNTRRDRQPAANLVQFPSGRS